MTESVREKTRKEKKNRIAEFYVNSNLGVFDKGTVSNDRDVIKHIEAIRNNTIMDLWRKKVQQRANRATPTEREKKVIQTNLHDWEWYGEIIHGTFEDAANAQLAKEAKFNLPRVGAK